jgi:hypothetical protein
MIDITEAALGDNAFWNEVRSWPSPAKILDSPLKKTKRVYLYASFLEDAPFGQKATPKGQWYYSDDYKLLGHFFLEVLLRQALFHCYFNGDAVPGLQKESFLMILNRLKEAGKEGAFEDFHGGNKTIEALFSWFNRAQVHFDLRDESDLMALFRDLSSLLTFADLGIFVFATSDTKAVSRLSEKLSVYPPKHQ